VELLHEEVSALNFDQLVESGFVEVLSEPEYSLSQLKKFEAKYGISTLSFYENYQQGFISIELKHHQDFNKWAYNYEIFLETGGSIQDLIQEEDRLICPKKEEDCQFSSFLHLDNHYSI